MRQSNFKYYVLVCAHSNTIGVPADVNQKVARLNYEWFESSNVDDAQKFYILDSLIKSIENSVSAWGIAYEFTNTHINQKIPGYFWNLAIVKTRESVLGWYVQNRTNYIYSLLRFDSNLFYIHGIK
jgi:hypothetical protein